MEVNVFLIVCVEWDVVIMILLLSFGIKVLVSCILFCVMVVVIGSRVLLVMKIGWNFMEFFYDIKYRKKIVLWGKIKYIMKNLWK